MEFNTLDEIALYFAEFRRTSTHQRAAYPVLIRKALVEFRGETGETVATIASAAGISRCSLITWTRAHKDGLYEDLSSSCAVSRQMKRSHSTATKQLEEARHNLLVNHKSELAAIDQRLRLVRELEDQGFTVTKRAA
jgi:transposase-like protein